MMQSKALAAAAALAATVLLGAASMQGAPRAPSAAATSTGVISGVVTGSRGPEAGVWVIAETNDLPTKFAKIVVTDDRGRYLLPDLPLASYDVWVRGYGLVDSPKRKARPGATLALRATPAPTPRAAAEYYPAGYWFSLIRIPAESEFPGTGPTGNGINPAFKSQAEYVRMVKNNACLGCHQMGSKGTRELHPALGAFQSSDQAWARRLASGQAGGAMMGTVQQMGAARTLRMFGDWTDRIAAGEVPPAPPRPQGIERNVVITMWDWADPKAYLHDLVSTDRRNPTVNANGPVYAVLEASADYMPVLDPETHTATRVPVTLRDSSAGPASPQQVAVPSPYWGTEAIWNSRANVHNPMLDERGRVWITARVRPPANPDFCKAGSTHPSASLFPLNGNAGRHVAVYDPKTKEMKHISTCFGTHHLMFAEDADRTLWLSGGGPVVGWVNTRLWDETGDEQRAQGWTALVLDINGNGRRDEYVEPNAPVDPAKDKRINTGQYGSVYALSPAPDGSVWGTTFGFPGAIIRLSPGTNPPHTALTEIFELPMNAGKPVLGFSPRGGDVDRNGVYWAALASGHMASFDRRKCRGPLNGPSATGQHCPEGWSFHAEPLPQLGNVASPGSGEGSYYTWVDQFGALGLGANVPINTGNQSEGLLALKDGKWVVLRVPYPMGFYTKWLDGRIDDPKAGWKGRGLWAAVSTRAPYHMEGGKGQTSKAIKFQLRPDPLAR
ncbi:MAG TPA: carboxypeptidase-like regulatory domain-containing protein [Gemmatimonadaceae bacterium]|nr:carboxypeptidase-like regulatory domain-containing protein [Gemmatimonadaceae bacterium]